MVQIEKILEKLDEAERTELGSFIHLLHDPLSRNILAKLASPHTSMCLNDLPLEKLDATDSVSVMSRLHKFENMKVILYVPLTCIHLIISHNFIRSAPTIWWSS